MRSFLKQLKWHSGLHSLGLSVTLCTLAGCGGGEDTTAAAPATDAAATSSDSGETPSAMMGSGMHGGDSSNMAAPPAGMPGGSMPGSMPGGMTQGPGPESGDSGSMAAMHGAGPPVGDAAAMSGGPGGAAGPPGMMPGGMKPGGMMPGGMPGSMPGGGPPAAQSLRSTDFARWSDKDFHDAIRERDEAVLKAIDARVKAKPNDPAVATLLTALLITSAEAPAPDAMTGGAMPGGFPGGGAAAFSSGDAGSGPMMSGPGGMPQGGAAPPRKSPRDMLQGGVPAGGAQMAPEKNSQREKIQLPIGPSSSLERKPTGRAVDSIELMLLESLVAFQQPGVMAGRGAAEALSSGSGPGMMGADEQSGLSGGDRRGGDDGAMLGSTPMGAPGMPGSSGMQGMGGGGGQNGGLDTRVLVRRILEHLVKNGSPVAWQTIFAVASGTTQTSLAPSEATQIVAESLLKNLEGGGAQVEQVLLAIVEGKAQLPPENRSVILSTMAAVSSAAADKLTGFDKASSLPAANQPGAMGMGMAGGFSGSMPGGRGDDDGAMGAAGSGAFGAPGMNPPGMGGGLGLAPAADVIISEFKDAELTRAAAFLWGPKNVTAIAEQLRNAADPMDSAELLKLAATIPNQKTREAVFAALSKVHSLGADTLRGAGVFSEVHDPGLLVVLKTLPRPKASRNEAQPMDSWTMTSEEIVLALRDKLKALSTKPGKLTAVNDGFPVKLHRNAVAEFSGVLTLPGTVGANLKDAAPSETKVYYARTGFTPQKPKDQDDIKEHYEARASGTARPDQVKQLLWIDGVKGGTTGVRRTMDVIIQANSNSQGFGGGGVGSGFGAPGAPAAGGAQGNAYTIEIIVVETADPKGSSSTASADSTPEKNEKK